MKPTSEEMQIVVFKKSGVIESNRQIVINESKGRLEKQNPGTGYDTPKPLASKEPPILNMDGQDNVWLSILKDLVSIISEIVTFIISLVKTLKIK